MPTDANEPDILGKLQRLLAVVPEHAFAAPPISRRTLADAAAEIKRLRNALANTERHDRAVRLYHSQSEQIFVADISANAYRTARQLLDFSTETGSLSISDNIIREICRANDSTVRSHLVELWEAGILRYARRGDNWIINFAAYPAADAGIEN